MAATVTIRVNTGNAAGTESDARTGIDLISADNATNSSANRAANPITAGNKSYEKWLTAKVDAAPDNYVDTFEVWGDGAVQSSTSLYIGKTDTGGTPTSADSGVATNDFTGYTSGNKFDWHSTDLTATNSVTEFLVIQLDVDADAAAGNWTQETINYSYNEA
jgi:hypothetical protein